MSIHWAVKYSTFAASVFTLSLFFAGWREVNTIGNPASFGLLAAGVVSTTVLLVLQAYWVYFEEKNKGTLRKPSRMFESLHAFIDKRFAGNKFIQLIQPVVSNGKDKCEN